MPICIWTTEEWEPVFSPIEVRTKLILNPKIPQIKIRIAVEILKAQAVATPEFPAAVIGEVQEVEAREVPPLQEALVPVVAVPPARRGAVPETFPAEAAVAQELLPAEAVQAEQ